MKHSINQLTIIKKQQSLLETHSNTSIIIFVWGWRYCITFFFAPYLGGPKAEDSGFDISLLFVNQEEWFVLCLTEILSCGHMSKPERLTPADMTSTPPRHKNSQIYCKALNKNILLVHVKLEIECGCMSVHTPISRNVAVLEINQSNSITAGGKSCCVFISGDEGGEAYVRVTEWLNWTPIKYIWEDEKKPVQWGLQEQNKQS